MSLSARRDKDKREMAVVSQDGGGSLEIGGLSTKANDPISREEEKAKAAPSVES